MCTLIRWLARFLEERHEHGAGAGMRADGASDLNDVGAVRHGAEDFFVAVEVFLEVFVTYHNYPDATYQKKILVVE